MAKKPDTKNQLLAFLTVILATAGVSKYREIENNPKVHDIISSTVLGKNIELYTYTPEYQNLQDALLEKNGTERQYNAQYEQNYLLTTGGNLNRVVQCAWYECGTEILSPTTPEEEQKILMNGGILLAVKTTVNGAPEAYYSASGIEKKSSKKIYFKITK